MPTLPIYYDDTFLDHDPPPGNFILPSSAVLAVDEAHPDRPERIRNIRHAIETTLADLVEWNPVTPAPRSALERVHDSEYLDELETAEPGDRLTPETGVGAETYNAARYAAGAAIHTAERALTTTLAEVPYAPVRPSGHHAQPTTADGFCYLNNVSIAAEHVLTTQQADTIAIIDWDVHHANGTQSVFYSRDDVLVVSLHNDFGSWGPHHPQTGAVDEHGAGSGVGYTVNVPLPPGTGDTGYAAAFDEIVEPVVAAFDPDLLLVSAGQDPGHLDPMARNLVSTSGFQELGRRVRHLAANHAGNALGLIQEGGYQLSHVAFATLAVLHGSLGLDAAVEEPFFVLDEHPEHALDWIATAKTTHAQYWPELDAE